MREIPILFSGAMVRAILDGSKTQTRRLVTVPWAKGSRALPYEPYYTDSDGVLKMADEYGDWHTLAEWVACPFGAVGDRLWVRETWHVRGACWSLPIAASRAAAPDAFVYAATPPGGWVGGWRPSIHMPHWASRLSLEVTGVRVERLQAMTAGDALAEGIEARPMQHPLDAVDAFARLWDSLYGAKPGQSWDDSPWVWVVEFRRVTT